MANICIIEDDQSFASALKRLMCTHHDVHCFSTVPEDPEAILSTSPDIIFLDAVLPGGLSRRFLAQLRTDQRVRSSAVILLSSHREMLKEANSLDSEREEFLKKPCTVRQVMAAVQRHLHRMQLQ